MKVDLHVHTICSKILFTNKWARFFEVKDCYSIPEEVYKIAKKRGMDLVAITDHNEIACALELSKKYEDVIVGAEYTVKASKKGHLVDVIVLDLDEQLHKEFLKLRKIGLKEFTKFAKKEGKPYFLCHIGYVVNPETKLEPKLIDEWLSYFDVIETINGSMQRENEFAQMLAYINNKIGVAGSDAHTLRRIGLTYTFSNAKNKEEFLENIIKGKVIPCGEEANLKKLKREALLHQRMFVKYDLKHLREKSLKKTLMIPFFYPFSPLLTELEIRNYRVLQEKAVLKIEKEYLNYKHEQINKGNFFSRWYKKRKYFPKIKNSFEKIKPTKYYIKEPTRLERLISKFFGYKVSLEENH